MTIRRIFVPLDGSELSSSVLPFVVDLAKPLNASVVAFHAVVPPVVAYPGAEPMGFDTRLLDDMAEGARTFLASVAGDLAAQGIDAKPVVVTGNAVDAIIALADEEGADLIAMSTHGRSGLGRLIMGSVADAVVRRSHRPVLLMRPAESKETGS